MQVPIAQAVESRAQIKAHKLGDCRTEVGVAVRIDGEALESREAFPLHDKTSVV